MDIQLPFKNLGEFVAWAAANLAALAISLATVVLILVVIAIVRHRAAEKRRSLRLKKAAEEDAA